MTKIKPIPENYDNVRAGIVELLQAARAAAARNVNSIHDRGLLGHWAADRGVEQAGNKRADYGEVLIEGLARDISASFGRGFGPRNIAQMRSFYLAWPGEKILQTLSAESAMPIPFNEIHGQILKHSDPRKSLPITLVGLRTVAFRQESRGAGFLRDRIVAFGMVDPPA